MLREDILEAGTIIDEHVTQGLSGNYEKGCTEECEALPPGVHVTVIAAACLIGAMHKLMCEWREVEPQEMWQRLMLAKAAARQ